MSRNWQPGAKDSETLLKIKEEMESLRKKTADELSARMKVSRPEVIAPRAFAAPEMDYADVEEESQRPARTKNVSTTFKYDRTGRLTGAISGRRTFTFNRAAQGGRIQSAVDNKNVAIEFIYDQNGKVTGAKSGKRKFVFNRNKQTGRIQSAMVKHMESVNA